MGEVIDARRRFGGDSLMTKRQLANYLGRSTRWVELRMGDGLPSYRAENGRRRFSRREVDSWLEERGYG